ncbi:aldehyde oxidoreductase molybdenum-binding subunit PaoC (plasmid) [Rhizobium leguminosarum]|jgi:xanthine dehydrogenase YagR molybdenum-binding subunit|uniref:Xanthine dehydrogenase family protein molybdopterin-binding subunit n=2 Tax=Rhizobium leguminosarum TaxID=384 RepID=A0A7M3DTL5_RHILE|nr:aldehyde oxidoreductase molybdenum-binding subunit PaoC [Rhizobium leguminosarum]MDH6661964.1 xanthine dehydrogenase YagR molybdenum-binding subunit [Rhizobium sophorae]AVC46936.1 molybdopterin-binding domain of aldehyde dehydrogenase family protein [Rhizobium leguminosarum bv. viciae]MBB4524855.1 xanthine dehydrogenase YagR molybdenum-binding subunit [Rhizobium leguminosarum]MBY5475675.1 xanthine dehydrogenase family protein molybdopterin-binding subunit [Rhizobium leguminosarum]MBY5496846
MQFDSPALNNPIDRMTVVGQPILRIDGQLKTTGRAIYAYEWHDANSPYAYGYPLGAAIAKGRIKSMDVTAAKDAPGVLDVVTTLDVGERKRGKFNTANLFGGDRVQHYHQAIAVVVAESFEQARAATALIKVDYAEEKGIFDLHQAMETAVKPESGDPDSKAGDFDAAFKAAAVTLEESYSTPDQSHAMMEPHASIAVWDGDDLTLWTSSQMIDWWRSDLATTLDVDKERIHVMSPFIGGGFGGKLFLRADAVLAAFAAKAVKRPVKVALPRHLMMNNTTHRPATVQRLRIGAEHDGKITAIAHESWSGDQKGGQPEAAVMQTRLLYAGKNRMTAMRLATLDLPEGNAMRAPGEAPGLMALEIAMDEMAEKLNIDPVEFRILNDTQVDPEKVERQFSHRNLNGCLKLGAERFGWSARGRPGSRREGNWLIGMGVATAFRNNIHLPSGARVRLNADGIVTVETDMTDIGTGSYTIIAQTAAEMMGLTIDRVEVQLGDSRFPVSAGSGGQFGANCSTSGVYAACVKLRDAISQKLGFNSEDTVFENGQVRSGNRSVSLADAAGSERLVGEDTIEWGDVTETQQQSTFGAHFVEVGVDVATGESRIRRMLAVCAAGRILNPVTARSQVIGAMTMGAGGALSEELAVDTRRGFFVNHDLAGYEVAVHADIPHQEVIFMDETDPMSSPMKAKGVGELGLCGVSAAIANAIFNATGVRVRHYPITLDKLLGGLPSAA